MHRRPLLFLSLSILRKILPCRLSHPLFANKLPTKSHIQITGVSHGDSDVSAEFVRAFPPRTAFAGNAHLAEKLHNGTPGDPGMACSRACRRPVHRSAAVKPGLR